MAIVDRYLTPEIAATLESKMVFIGGPTRVAKTTLALSLLTPDGTERHPAYLNWDDPKTPPRLRRGELPIDEPVVILDEIHKYARWRNLVKGLHDTENHPRESLCVLPDRALRSEARPCRQEGKKLYLWARRTRM
jgi:uncharacterized protein